MCRPLILCSVANVLCRKNEQIAHVYHPSSNYGYNLRYHSRFVVQSLSVRLHLRYPVPSQSSSNKNAQVGYFM